MDWRASAACLSADPDLFFPVGSAGTALDQVRDAKRVCAGCPVLADCLEWALAAGGLEGVWGGLTAEERSARRRRGGVARLAPAR